MIDQQIAVTRAGGTGHIRAKLNSLSDKVEKHNNFDRRLIVIETKLGIDKKEKNA